MKVLIIASKRKVAKQLAKQALAHGHVVTVLQSRGLRIRFRNPRYRRLKGNVLNEGSLAPAMAGQEAVVCWLSMWPSRKPTTYFWEGTANVIRAMLNAGVSRLVCVTACGAGESKGHCGFFREKIVRPLFLRPLYEDWDRQEDLIRETELDWTIVRPARLTGKAPTGKFLILTDLRNFKATKISRADVVAFTIEQVANNFYLGQAPVITY